MHRSLTKKWSTQYLIFKFFEFAKNLTNSPKNAKMSRTFRSFLIRDMNISTVKRWNIYHVKRIGKKFRLTWGRPGVDPGVDPKINFSESIWGRPHAWQNFCGSIWRWWIIFRELHPGGINVKNNFLSGSNFRILFWQPISQIEAECWYRIGGQIKIPSPVQVKV